MISDVISLVSTVIQRVVPDKNAQAEALNKLATLQANGELQLMLGQQEINKVEAGHRSVWVAGWRPAIGWTCALALCNNWIVFPYLISFGVEVVRLDTSEMWPVIAGLLGLGGMRTYEKFKGVSK